MRLFNRMRLSAQCSSFQSFQQLCSDNGTLLMLEGQPCQWQYTASAFAVVHHLVQLTGLLIALCKTLEDHEQMHGLQILNLYHDLWMVHLDKQVTKYLLHRVTCLLCSTLLSYSYFCNFKCILCSLGGTLCKGFNIMDSRALWSLCVLVWNPHLY